MSGTAWATDCNDVGVVINGTPSPSVPAAPDQVQASWLRRPFGTGAIAVTDSFGPSVVIYGTCGFAGVMVTAYIACVGRHRLVDPMHLRSSLALMAAATSLPVIPGTPILRNLRSPDMTVAGRGGAHVPQGPLASLHQCSRPTTRRRRGRAPRFPEHA